LGNFAGGGNCRISSADGDIPGSGKAWDTGPSPAGEGVSGWEGCGIHGPLGQRKRFDGPGDGTGSSRGGVERPCGAAAVDTARRSDGTGNLFAKETYNSKIFVEEIVYDGKITEKDITLELTDLLEVIQPCGMGNPVPLFLIEKVKIENLTYFGNDKHIRLRFVKKGFSIMIIGFGMGSNSGIRMLRDGDVVNAIVTPYTNEYKDKKNTALRLKDIKLV
jgi:hypothetical protein